MKLSIHALGGILILTAALAAAQGPTPQAPAGAAKSTVKTAPTAPAAAAPADPALKTDPATVEDVTKFLQTLQFEKSYQERLVDSIPSSVKSSVASNLRHAKPDITPEEIAKGQSAAQSEIDAAVKKMDYATFVKDKLTPIFQQHFTHTDLAAINQFFSSPAGVKYLHNVGPVMQPVTQTAMELRKEQFVLAVGDASLAARHALGLPDEDPKPAPAAAKPATPAATAPAATAPAKPATPATNSGK